MSAQMQDGITTYVHLRQLRHFRQENIFHLFCYSIWQLRFLWWAMVSENKANSQVWRGSINNLLLNMYKTQTGHSPQKNQHKFTIFPGQVPVNVFYVLFTCNFIRKWPKRYLIIWSPAEKPAKKTTNLKPEKWQNQWNILQKELYLRIRVLQHLPQFAGKSFNLKNQNNTVP